MLKQSITSSTEPMVSCIMPTRDRKGFFRQAIRYFQAQSYRSKELVVIDDGRDNLQDLIPQSSEIRYLRLSNPMSIGNKLNLGIEMAKGDIIQRIDDDDYYASEFLATTMNHLVGHDPQSSIVGLDGFLVLIVVTGELKFSGKGWFSDSTLCFYRSLWEKKPFRDVPKAADWWFKKDHDPQKIKIDNPELHIVTRHQSGHNWTRIGDGDVTDYFRRQPNYSKPLKELLPRQDFEFYQSLRQREGD